MKYSQTIGIIACLILVALCFFPWSFIASQQITVSGFHAEGTSFGKPGLFTAVLSAVMLLFFSLNTIWAKRSNVFIAAFNLAWSVRNYLLLSSCMMGECPEKKPALYAVFFVSLLIQFMTFLPKINVKQQA